MPKVEYQARLLADGHLSCPHEVVKNLNLHIGSHVKVVLEKEPDRTFKAPVDISNSKAVIARIKEFGKKMAGRDVNLGNLILEGKEELENRA